MTGIMQETICQWPVLPGERAEVFVSEEISQK
jgi:hypothetical protein